MSRLIFLPVRTPLRLVKNCSNTVFTNEIWSKVVRQEITAALLFYVKLFYTEHDQRFSSTRKGRKIHMSLSRRFCPIKLPSSGNLEYPPNFSVTFTEKISNFPSFNILLCRNYFMFPCHFPKNFSRFAEEYPLKQALDLGHRRVAILPARNKCFYRCYIFKGTCLMYRIGLKAMNCTQYQSTVWQGHDNRHEWNASFPMMSSGDLPALTSKWLKKRDTLPKRCTMTMHHEISARGSLMPAGDGSALLSDTLSPTRQWGREKSAPRPYETDPFRWQLSSILLTYTEVQPCIYMTMSSMTMSSIWYVLRFEHAHELKTI